MSTTLDACLSDALHFIDLGREACERNDIPGALLYLCSSERFCGMALGMKGAHHALGMPTPNTDAVQDKIAALRAMFIRVVVDFRRGRE